MYIISNNSSNASYVCAKCVYGTCKSPLNVLIFVFPQFFDRDGDGVVSGADLSGHLPFRSLSHLHGNNSRQTQGYDYEETLPNEMNMGE